MTKKNNIGLWLGIVGAVLIDVIRRRR